MEVVKWLEGYENLDDAAAAINGLFFFVFYMVLFNQAHNMLVITPYFSIFIFLIKL